MRRLGDLAGLCLAGLARLILGGEHEVVPQQLRVWRYGVLLREAGYVADLAQIDDEGLLDAEDGVRGLVWVAAEVQSSGKNWR